MRLITGAVVSEGLLGNVALLVGSNIGNASFEIKGRSASDHISALQATSILHRHWALRPFNAARIPFSHADKCAKIISVGPKACSFSEVL